MAHSRPTAAPPPVGSVEATRVVGPTVAAPADGAVLTAGTSRGLTSRRSGLGPTVPMPT